MEVRRQGAEGGGQNSEAGGPQLPVRGPAPRSLHRVIDNQGRIVPKGSNAAIGAVRGEIIIRLDAHTPGTPRIMWLAA